MAIIAIKCCYSYQDWSDAEDEFPHLNVGFKKKKEKNLITRNIFPGLFCLGGGICFIHPLFVSS